MSLDKDLRNLFDDAVQPVSLDEVFDRASQLRPGSNDEHVIELDSAPRTDIAGATEPFRSAVDGVGAVENTRTERDRGSRGARRRRANRAPMVAIMAAAAVIAAVVYSRNFSPDPAPISTVTEQADGNGAPSVAAGLSEDELGSQADEENSFSESDPMPRAEDSAEPDKITQPDQGTVASGESSDTLLDRQVVARPDGTFLEFISVYTSEDQPSFAARRSTDGETWEPVQLSGLPAGLQLRVEAHGDYLIAIVHTEKPSEIFGDFSTAAAISRDGINWTTLNLPNLQPVEGWGATTSVRSAAFLPDGQIIAIATRGHFPDLDALGFGPANYCEPYEVTQQAITLQCWSEMDDADGETVTVPMTDGVELSGPPQVWIFDSSGENPRRVAIDTADGLAPSSLVGSNDSVLVGFAPVVADLLDDGFSMSSYVEGVSVVASTTDGETWTTNAVSAADDVLMSYPPAANTTSRLYVGLQLDVQRLARVTDEGLTIGEIPLPESAVESNFVWSLSDAGIAVATTEIQFADEQWLDEEQWSSELGLPFNYTSADGATLTGTYYGFFYADPALAAEAETTPWILTTPDGVAYTYEVTAGAAGENISRSDDMVLTFHHPDTGEDLLTVWLDEIEAAGDMDAFNEALEAFDAEMAYYDGDMDAYEAEMADTIPRSTIFFSDDDGASWRELLRVDAEVTSLAVGDDEVVYTMMVPPEMLISEPVRHPIG